MRRARLLCKSAAAAVVATKLLVGSGWSQAAPRTALERETVERVQAYLRINTTNPPGNETRGAAFFARILADAGIEYETAESAPGRGNVWARLRGGDEPGLVLLHHMDVVPADESRWVVPPLSGNVRDGYIYGRGALDTKTLGILHLQAFLALHRAARPLNRDVVFVATADEEAGGLYGAGWLVEHRADVFRGVGLLLNEGGTSSVTNDRQQFGVEVTQKVPLWLRLTAAGEPGHGSTPRTESAVTRLLRALTNVRQHRFPARIVPPVDAFFKGLAPGAREPWRDLFQDLASAVTDPEVLNRLQLDDPFLHGLTRNTCSITRLQGSSKINVVPPTATAEVDCRLLPDQDQDAFLAEVETVINDPAVRIETIMAFSPAISSTDTDLYRAIGAAVKHQYPGAAVFPAVTTGFTDSHFFRDLGIASYGFDPMLLPAGEDAGIHGNNERISVENVHRGVRLMKAVVERVVYDR